MAAHPYEPCLYHIRNAYGMSRVFQQNCHYYWRPACTTNPRYGFTIGLLIINMLRTSETRKLVRIPFGFRNFHEKRRLGTLPEVNSFSTPDTTRYFRNARNSEKFGVILGTRNIANRRCSFFMGKYIRCQPLKILDECLRRVKAAKPAGADIVDADLHRRALITGWTWIC